MDAGTGFEIKAAEALVLGPDCQHFSLAELETATQGYPEGNVVGEGGFGKARAPALPSCEIQCNIGKGHPEA